MKAKTIIIGSVILTVGAIAFLLFDFESHVDRGPAGRVIERTLDE